MSSNCMYGPAHPGTAMAVRSKRGALLGWVCPDHYREHKKVLVDNGYHFWTPGELLARGEGGRAFAQGDNADMPPGAEWEGETNGGKGHEGRVSASVDTSGTEEQQFVEHEHPGGDKARLGTPSERDADRDAGRQPHGSTQAGRLADSGRQLASGDAGAETKELETVSSREAPGQRGLPSAATRSQAVALPDWPTWAQGAGHLTLTTEQRAILQDPFRDGEITIRYDGVVYAPWRRYWSRMIEAFAPAVPAVIPIDNPRFQGSEIVVGVVMVCGGTFIGKAWGSHRLEGDNDKMSVGDRIESAISDAVAKIGKRLNMGEDLWDDNYRAYWKSQHAESYTKGNRTYWRRRPVASMEEHE